MIQTKPVVKRSRKSETLVRRQQILDAACALIFERGFDMVSMTDIGAVAGVSGPALYRHFSSKAEILAVLCNHTVDRLIEFVGPRRADPRTELAALIEGQALLVAHYPQLVRVFEDEERALPDELRRQVRRREREHAQRWVDVMEVITPETPVRDLEMLVYATVGMILSAPRWPRPLREDPTLKDKLTAAAWRMLNLQAPARVDRASISVTDQ